MPIGPALGADLLNYVFRGQAVTPPTTLYASVGTYVSGTITEIASARIPVRVTKGTFRGNPTYGDVPITDPYIYSDLYFQAGEEYVIPIGGAAEVANPRLFWYKDAAGGTPYFIGQAQSSLYPYAYPGDLWAISGGITSSYAAATGIANSTPGFAFRMSTYAGQPFWSLMRDHFWRGIPSYSVADYPNVYLSMCSMYTDPPTTVYVPRFAIARDAANWTAPAVDATGYSYITNTNVINFNVTVGFSGGAMYPHISMLGARTNYDDRMFTSYLSSQTVPGGVNVPLAAGDIVQFPIGGFKIGVW